MKKMIALFLSLALFLPLVACSSGGNGNPNTSGSGTQSSNSGTNSSDATNNTPSDGGSAYTTSSGWPNKAITLICPYDAGGSSDLGCRYTAQSLQQILGVPVVVENVPGASGWLGWEQTLASEPDGYTFCLANNSIVTGQYSDVDPKDKNENDFEFLAAQVVEPMVMIKMADDTKYDDWDSFIEYCKTTDPIFPSNGLAKLNPHAAFIDFMRVYYDINVAPVSVDSSKDNELMLQSGDVDFAIIALADVAANIENGTYKIVALFSNEKPAAFPDAPLIGEVSGINFPLNTVRGYAFPKGVDQEIVETMAAALKEAITSDECVAQMAAMNTVTNYKSGQECRDMLVSEVQQRRELCGDI